MCEAYVGSQDSATVLSHDMTTLRRFQETGQLHYVTFSCFGKRPYLLPPERRTICEDCLESARAKHGFIVFGHVIMSTHVHLLISEPPDKLLAIAIQGFKIAVSLRMPETPFWYPRYYDFNVHSEQKRIEKLRYMHRNPVTAGLVTRKEDWEWSSFRYYRTGVQGRVQIHRYEDLILS